MSDLADLTLALKVQYERDTDSNITDKIISEIKNSIIFNYNWQYLLQPAPIAISSLGACCAACFGDAGMKVTLKPPPSGSFKFIDSGPLSEGLARLGNNGRLALQEANQRMELIKSESRRIENHVKNVINVVADPGGASQLLQGHMDTMAEAARDWLECAVSIDKRFEDWLMYTMELYAACIGTQSSDEEKARATSISLIVEQSRFDSQRDNSADTKAASEKLGKQLDSVFEAFRKGSNNFPPGWEIFSQEIVSALTNCGTSALSQLMMTHMLNLNPTAKTVAGAGMFSDLIYPKRDGSSGSSASAQEHLPPAQQVVSALSQDPAYSVVQKEMPYLNVLHKLLTSGNNGGVNWDEATLSADYVLQMLQDAAHKFNDVSSSDGQPSKNLKSILATTSEISGTLVSEAKKGVAMGNKFPQADSADVKGWQARVQESYKQAQQMTAFARALPGGSPVGSTLMAIPLDPNEVIAKSNVKSAQAQATRDAINNRLLTAQDCYIKTQMLYNNSVKLATAQKENLIATQTQLKRLNEKNAGIEEIKTLLESCINVTIEVKTQIMNLVILLRSISATIEEVTKFIAAPFIKQIQAIETRGDQTKTIGPFSLIDLQRSLVYSSATMICSHYSVVGDIVAMWARLSGNDLQPGFPLLDEIFSTKNDLSKRQACQTLLTWADHAIGDIQNFAEEFNRKISDDMTTQNTEMAKMIGQSKVPKTPEIVNAIQAGTDEVLNAATATIAANANARPLGRSAPIKV